MDTTELGYALLFAVPVGGGVATAVLKVGGGGFLDPLVVGSGVTAAAAVFLFLAVAVSVGDEE